ncbi:MAG: amidohydrolase family protein, partial [Bacteroidota bacterium]
TLVDRAMQAGALGLSSGLYYAPASFADTEEVIALAEVSAQYGGIYDAHIRDESTYNVGLLAAVLETLEIGEQAGLPVNISHIKCLGVDVWGMSTLLVDTINAARARGVQVTADQYPYLASGTSLSNALLPKWVFADMDDFTPKLSDPELQPRIEAGMAENLCRRGGPASLLLTYSDVPGITGKTLAEVANARGEPAVTTAIDILKQGGSAVASFNMNQDDVHHFMQQPWVMTCSDGTNAHPRKYGTFPKKIREFVREKQVLSLGQMIRQSTQLTAETFGIPERGSLREGYFADVLIFKPEEVIDHATFREPAELSSGFTYIVLNGKVVVDGGAVKVRDGGRVVRRASASGPPPGGR